MNDTPQRLPTPAETAFAAIAAALQSSRLGMAPSDTPAPPVPLISNPSSFVRITVHTSE